MSSHYAAIIPLIAFLSYVALIFLTAKQDSNKQANRLFIWYLFLLMMWSFGSFMAYANFPLMSTYFWNTFLIVSAFFASVALFHFVRVFLNKPVPWLWISLGYGIFIIATIAATMGYVVKDAYHSGGQYHLELGIASYIMWPVAFMFAGATIFNLVKGYRSEKDLFEIGRAHV